MNEPEYYVTICVKTPAGTRAISSRHNAKFKSLSAAEKYKESLKPTIENINQFPPKGITIKGERIAAITSNPAPNISYEEPAETNEGVEELRRRTQKEPEYVQLYHGGRVKKSTVKWFDRQQESATMIVWAILAAMLAIALCNNQP
jgi:hypothetical protein